MLPITLYINTTQGTEISATGLMNDCRSLYYHNSTITQTSLTPYQLATENTTCKTTTWMKKFHITIHKRIKM
jgi:hypothetical protein